MYRRTYLGVATGATLGAIAGCAGVTDSTEEAPATTVDSGGAGGGGGDDSWDDPPTTDAEGKDIADVPRYPGSVRTFYMWWGDEDGDETMIYYLVEAETDREIMDFYAAELPKHGWGDLDLMETSAFCGVYAMKDGGSVDMVFSESEDWAGYRDILVMHYVPK